MFRSWRSVGVEEGTERSAEAIAACFDTYDQSEGMAAFLDGREPAYQGR